MNFLKLQNLYRLPCQGIIAVENRADDGDIRDVLKAIIIWNLCMFVAERAFLKAMDSGCQTP